MQWARASLAPLAAVGPGSPWDDLESLGYMIGDAKVVALSEADHCAAEQLEFRNRVLQYLVRDKNFTAIAIESGLVEGRIVSDYVRGGAGDIQTILAHGISWTFDRSPQNRTLIEWLRTYNADSCHARKVNFYGFDLPGSPGNADTRRGVDTALTEALAYLGTVDAAAAAVLRDRLDASMRNLRFSLLRSNEGSGYERLNPIERDALTAAIADLIASIERCEAHYVAASTARDYAYGYRAAVCARQMDQWLRQIPIGWQPLSETPECASEQIRFLSVANDVRDRAQADNLDWILEQEGPAGKILVFAARYHLSGAPLKMSFWGDKAASEQQVAGTYLRRRLGQSLVTIGNLIGHGETGAGEDGAKFERASRDSIDGLAGDVGVPRFLLDLRTAPDVVSKWLNQEHSLEVAGSQVLKLNLAQAFDILFYLDTVTPACDRGL